MKLVIVESPAKCETIQRYLGSEYIVKASLGHIRDLATRGKGGLGVDVDNAFAPTYVINKGKEAVVNELKTLSKKTDEVILATDPDREGEAIAWHLAQVLNLDVKTNKRLEFHEITRESISNAIKEPRVIDLDLVSSQETRRIIDRIIGFKLSNLMMKKIGSKSAGRVQSATLKLIYDHDKEIKEFVPTEYWAINVKILINNKEQNLEYIGKKDTLIDKKTTDELLASLGDNIKVKSVSKTERFKEAPEPFMTATLQQEAFAKLGFSTKKTQSVAQKLYEGISIGGEHMGLITYMRTDVTNLSSTFIARANEYIAETFGAQYIGKPKKSKVSDFSQGAHEGIRPTRNHNTPEKLRPYLDHDQYALYKLIYNRTLSYLMKPKKDEILIVHFENNFKCEFKHNIFKGYTILSADDDSKDFISSLPSIAEGQEFPIIEKTGEQKYTTPPAPYTEAKIVKLMQEVGIGRPSTYASTIDTLQKRKYITINKGEVSITDQGILTANVLGKYFPDIVNVKYTAKMENDLDNIQEGEDTRLGILNDFYTDFNKQVNDATNKIYKEEAVKTGEFCPVCGSPLVIKDGKNGKFIGCSNYPTCKYVKKEEKTTPELVGKNCPECGRPLVYRKDKKGKKFVACSGYPTCKYIENNKQIKIEYTEKDYVKKCPKCDGYLVKKRGKFTAFLGCTNYPSCTYMEKIKKGKN